MSIQVEVLPIRQKLHRANYDADQADQCTPADNTDNIQVEKIDELLKQIFIGFEADDVTNLQKLTRARKYGRMLWELKAITPHGSYRKLLKERFPTVSYPKCNRWMFIAKHETEVASAIEKYPDVAWGPKKMIDFLNKTWAPERNANDDELDEDDCLGRAAQDEADEGQLSDPAYQDDSNDGPTDDEPQYEFQDRWEETAVKAEAKAKDIGKEPLATPSQFTLSVMVYSEPDHAAIQECLLDWQPKSRLLQGNKQTHTVTARIPPDEIQKLLTQLCQMFTNCPPTKIKVSIDL